MKKLTIELLKSAENKWVAFDKSRTRVLTIGSSVKEVEVKLAKKKKKAYQIEFIPSLGSSYVPLCS